jgi:hypothetical protein
MSAFSRIGGTEITAARQLLLKDNSQYLERVNQAELQKQFILPTTTVVLTQDPPPGTQVPVGTQINLTLVNKGDIPTNSLGASAAVAKKWARAGDVLSAVEGAGSAFKAVLDKGVEYEALSAGDKAVVDGFLRQQVPDADPATAYADVGFIYEL